MDISVGFVIFCLCGFGVWRYIMCFILVICKGRRGGEGGVNGLRVGLLVKELVLFYKVRRVRNTGRGGVENC